ncbi:response regulator transcription factor [Anaeropeptidivorans aminofermentans]|uniref:response regulator transcription factor n=1 Tax=Anaeropeptidivorans aminofermentans TaxID=2934315 RepID=UPI000EC76CAB|nr:response regulator transcription factor [Anaeropeptidivorans aminofermentans]MBE6012782.1 response regulator transcription factor [Lachnospiraceae bacterium]HAQ41991.1 DNA-binding response regulator [Clostridiales bacterium]
MIRILVVDDDKNIQKLISKHLNNHGYETECAGNGSIALSMMEKNYFDMLIVDVMMPMIDGYELTTDIRSVDKQIPILMITAKDTFADKKRGFTSGIDDYMTKPIDFEEMILRVEALLRRAKISADRKLEVGNVLIDFDSRSIIMQNENIELPRKEFDLLYKLLSYPNKTFTRRQLMDEIWGMESDADERTVDVHIRRLRERFSDNDSFEIVTVRGLGYKAEYLK